MTTDESKTETKEQTKPKKSVILKPDELGEFEDGKDAKNWLVSSAPQEKWVEYQGKKWRFLIRIPSWGTLVAIADRCKEYDKDGNVSGVSHGRYLRELLKTIISESPFGQVNDVTLSQLSPAAGKVMEALVESLDLGADDDVMSSDAKHPKS